ncbi:MAG: 50S ribosomal protein L17 [Chloroherpetonaceae bacterium]|nr:50S ribosomal protein L17 [Chloroherpetonaceae bacterium]MCS7210934.1 50S ribosomal protein L17 [Chloroherpetonaceae bacterium]MDW8019751.1 50S ribosomal protein L17 [Chloroherpetonaceae bacterium]MDW8464886.1 50S ribosomal protein L17 [Chloroherpetonaceae bacterium]
MRKRISLRKLGRTASHRRATMANLCTQLILHKRIRTTEAKAKEMRRYIEPLITRAKEGTGHAQREVFKFIRNKKAVKELFTEIANKVGDRPGGYTRVIKMVPRYGDAAKMAMIELVDYSEAPTERRRQRQDREKRVRGSKEAQSKAAAAKESTEGKKEAAAGAA